MPCWVSHYAGADAPGDAVALPGLHPLVVGRDAAWFEELHAPFRDHLADRIAAALAREGAHI